MSRLRLDIAYDGTAYYGWQDNCSADTVESVLRKALETYFQEPLTLEAASRTDSGVHARGQVVACSPSCNTFDIFRVHKSINSLLPHDIRVLDIYQTRESFHPSLEAIGKWYTYKISNGRYQIPWERNYAWHVPAEFDIKAMQGAFEVLKGEHDFTSFANVGDVGANSRCHLEQFFLVHEEGECFSFHLKGDRFLYKMVRNLVGTVISVGKRKIDVEDVSRILESGDRRYAGMTAPAHGLYLERIEY